VGCLPFIFLLRKGASIPGGAAPPQGQPAAAMD